MDRMDRVLRHHGIVATRFVFDGGKKHFYGSDVT